MSEYKEFYTYLYLNEKSQIVTEKTDRPANFINVREDGSFIQPRTAMHICRVIREELKIKTFDFHTLRHTHATMLDTNGASIHNIKDRLGHFNIKTTNRYTHNNEKLINRTVKIINELYTKQG